MKRIFVAVKQRSSDGSITPILDWYVLECGHLVSRHRSVAADPRKMYCSKCSRAARERILCSEQIGQETGAESREKGEGLTR